MLVVEPNKFDLHKYDCIRLERVVPRVESKILSQVATHRDSYQHVDIFVECVHFKVKKFEREEKVSPEAAVKNTIHTQVPIPHLSGSVQRKKTKNWIFF